MLLSEPTESAQRRRKRRPGSGDLQIGFFVLADDGVYVPSPEAIQAENQPILAIRSAVNYRITASDQLGRGSLRTKARDNLAAIRTIKQILREARHATPEEQAILVRYVGWGGLPKVFDDTTGERGEVGAQLRDLLSEPEWLGAAASTLNAHYTSESVIRGLWDLLADLGFTGGATLEPSAGIGHFAGLMPDGLSDNSRWTLVEIDPITAAIGKALYPDHDYRASAFEAALLPDDAFDLAISNVPFGNYPVHDPIYNPQNASIHNYFFLRALAAVRPNGVVAFLTSRYTMDQVDPGVRRAIRDHADLIGAIRLPEDAFDENANTRVVTDLVLLRKRPSGEEPTGADWMETGEVATANGPARANEYWRSRPEQILGTASLRSSQYGAPTLTVCAPANQDLRSALREAARGFTAGTAFAFSTPAPRLITDSLDATDRGLLEQVKDGAFALVRGTLRVRDGAAFADHGLSNPKDVERVSLLVELREATREVLRTQNDNEPEEMQARARQTLNELYDGFVLRFGPINLENRTTNRLGIVTVRRPNLTSFRRDPEAMLVAALELYDPETQTAAKAPIFFQRVIRPHVEIRSCEHVNDALLVTLDRLGRVDVGEIARLWGGRTEEEAIQALGGRIYLDPETRQWLTADLYLAGEVRKKLRAARRAAKENARFEANVVALEQVQPEDLTPSQIDAALGSTWISPEDIVRFLRDLLGPVTTTAEIEISHIPQEALWSVTAPPHVKYSAEATRTWGTGRAHTFRLVSDSLNQRRTQIYDQVLEWDEKQGRNVKRSVRNLQASLDAQEKQDLIEERFAAWVWEDLDRAERLLAVYNETFNGIRPPTYDGSHLTLGGASSTIALDAHQKNGVWRILQSGNTLVAHEVGLGKTFLSVAAGMEMKRLGIATKPCYVTLNYMLEQFSREFLQLYPNARLLIAGTEDLVGDGRRRFMSRVTTGDWDAIVMTYASFGKLGMPVEFEREFIQEQLGAYEAMLQEVDGDDRLTRKQLEGAKKRLLARLEALANRETKDTVLSFDQTGIDFLVIDEAHLAKNLDTPTKIQGIPKASKPSQRAHDLLMKIMYLERIRPGRNTVFLTGTPISNTLAEIYVMLFYLAPGLMRQAGIRHFDAWAATFTKRVPVLELAPDGSTYRMRVRFHFQNVAELISLWRMVADVVYADDVALQRPAVAGGEIQMVAAPASPELQQFVPTLVRRAERIQKGGVDPREDNMLAVTNDGRKAALDMRLVMPFAPEFPGSKVHLCAANVARHYHETSSADRLTQLVFCDLGTPTGQVFSVYNELKRLLAGLGVKGPDIAFVHDADNDIKKARLFGDVRAGRVRILIASTEKAGMGANVQDRLLAIHHLDAPWRPADVEQRDGRGRRRGNRNSAIWIYRYVTEESFDAYIWNLLEYKQRMISSIMRGDLTVRRIEDIDSTALSFAQLKALASGSQAVMEKARIDAEIMKLRRAKQAFQDRHFQTRRDLLRLPAEIQETETLLAQTRSDLGRRKETHGDLFAVQLNDTEVRNRPEAGVHFRNMLLEATMSSAKRTVFRFGHFAGFELLVSAHRGDYPEIILKGEREYAIRIALDDSGAAGNLQALEHMPRRLESVIGELERHLQHLRQQLTHLQSIESETFPREEELAQLEIRQRELEAMLSKDEKKQDFGSLEVASLQADETDLDDAA